MDEEERECQECGELLEDHEEEEFCTSCQDYYDSEYGSNAFDSDYNFEPSFADPGGRSALRAATEDNPRNLPCPTCGEPNRLTPEDKARGYCCDRCADLVEGNILSC